MSKYPPMHLNQLFAVLCAGCRLFSPVGRRTFETHGGLGGHFGADQDKPNHQGNSMKPLENFSESGMEERA